MSAGPRQSAETLAPALQRQLPGLGHRLDRFAAACGRVARQSDRGTAPGWVRQLTGGRPVAAGAPLARTPGWLVAQRRRFVLDPRGGFPVDPVFLALFRLAPLRPFWGTALRAAHRRRLEGELPDAWILDPTPLPVHAVVPRLGLRDWREFEGGAGFALLAGDGGPAPASVSQALEHFPDRVSILVRLPDDGVAMRLDGIGDGAPALSSY